MEEDPGHILEIIKETGGDLEVAADKLGTTPGYLASVQERFEEDENTVDVEAFPLAAGEAIPHQSLPSWLTKPLPKKTRGRWPGGAKSPSWFTRISKCARNHAQRYRYKRPDPSGLDAIIGNAIHGALQDAARIRQAKRRGAPMNAGKEELLFHLERQPEVVHDRGTEVLRRSREVIEDMKGTVELNNVWGAEFVWSFHASAGLLIAGIADLILVYPDPNNPTGPPELVLIIDYKTGPGQVPSQEELRDDPQACLQLIWAKRFFQGAKRVQFLLWNVGQNEKVPIDWDYGIERNTMAFVRACWNLWCQNDETANVTNRCRFCPYRSDCKAYSQELAKEVYRPKDSLENKTIEELMPISYRSRLMGDLADTRRKDANELIMALLGPGQKKYKGSRLTAYRKTKKMESLGSVSDTLFKLSETTGTNLASLLDACTSIGPQRLKAWVKTLPEDKRDMAEALIDSLKQVRSSPPWIEVRDHGAAF